MVVGRGARSPRMEICCESRPQVTACITRVAALLRIENIRNFQSGSDGKTCKKCASPKGLSAESNSTSDDLQSGDLLSLNELCE